MKKEKEEKIDIQEILNKKRVVLISGVINSNLIREISEKIIALNEVSDDDITLIINSPGGCLESTFQLCDIIDYINCDVQTVGLGEICSGGLILFMNGTNGKRIITPNTTILSHRYHTGTCGDHEDLIAMNKQFKLYFNKMVNHYKKCTGLTEKEIKNKLLKKENVWLTPKEAIKYKLADKILRRKR